LAKRAATTQAVINKIEKGKSLRPRNIQKLAETLETSPAWLQFGIADLDKLDTQSVGIAIKLAELPADQRKAIETTINSLLEQLKS
jgi:hypothetical protein